MRPGDGASVSTTSGRTMAPFSATSARWKGSGASSGKVLATMGEAYDCAGRSPARRAGLASLRPVAVLLALLSSVMWGSSDFLGGLRSRIRPAMAVVGGSQLCGLLAIATVALVTGA